MSNFLVLMFAVSGGLTLSGIVANFYRLVADKPQNRAQTLSYYAVMVLAGPSVLFENATKSFRKKDCSAVAYGFAVAIAAYWAFVLGLILMEIVVSVWKRGVVL